MEIWGGNLLNCHENNVTVSPMSLQKFLMVLRIRLFSKIALKNKIEYEQYCINGYNGIMPLWKHFNGPNNVFFLMHKIICQWKMIWTSFLWASPTYILEHTLSNLVCIHIKHAGNLMFSFKQNSILLVSHSVESLKHTGFVFCCATTHLISHKTRYHERQDSISAWIAQRFSFLSPCSPSVHGRKVFIMWSFWKAVETLMASDRCRIS